jgi:hypothetical protein
MNTQPANQNDLQQKVELRIRTMRTLWIALLGSLGLYYVMTVFVERSEAIEPNNILSLILICVAVTTVLVSFPIKSTLLARAIQQQQVQLVQQAYVVAWALSEVAGLLGMLDFFLTGNRYYFVLILIGVCGELLHFPRREHIIAAWSKTPIA